MDAQQALQQGMGAVASLPPGLSAPATSAADDQVAKLKRRLDEEQMRSLQLQCVLDAKDRKLTLVRQHISSGEARVQRQQCWLSESDTLLQALQLENEALRRQLAETKAALQAAQDTQPQLPPPPPPVQHRPTISPSGASSSSDRQHMDTSHATSTAASLPFTPAAKWPQQSKQQAVVQHSTPAASSSAAPFAASCSDEPDEVLVLNVSGMEMHALRSTLTLVPSSHLCRMFRRHSKLAPPWDDKRRFFLPFKASAFAMVLEALQAQQVLGIKPCTCNWMHSSPDHDVYFQILLKLLDLHDWFFGDSVQNHMPNNNTSNLGAAAAQPKWQANVIGAAAKGSSRHPQSSNGLPAASYVERVSPGPSAAPLPLALPEAVAAALRPRANAEAGAENGGAPTALDATQAALAGLKVPNMYEPMAKKAAADT